MNSLQECVNEYIKDGYTRNYAISKVCQDIIINRIYNSKYSDKITIKGGVVMFHLTQNIRRATIDIDMDLINMSIATDNIVNIFMELGKLDNIDVFKLEIDKYNIEELSHQDYHGKRLTVTISDGIPKYIESFREQGNIYDEIKNHVMNKQSYLYEEPNFLLQNEVSEIGSYFSIIKSIAAGNRKLGNISSNLSVNPTNLSKYLQILINLDILEREVPITEANPEKSKKGQYKIKDNFIAFWFQFIYPNRAFLEMDKNNVVLRKIKTNFIDNHVSYIYEDICKEKMWNLMASGKLEFQYEKIGRWWNNSEEIDIVGLNEDENNIIFGECKYYKDGKTMGVKVFYDLKEKSKLVDWKNKDRKERFILFSASGYSAELEKLAKENDNLILVK